MMGLYYHSASTKSVVDRDIFDPINCGSIKHCVQSDNGYIVFALEDAENVALNIIPMNLN